MQPLCFLPLFKRLRWGGRRLGTVLGKPIGEGNDYAESWEVCDHGADQSIVADGPYRGWALSRLVRERGAELLGRHAGIEQFPLLLKYLDASDRLSVQVHPDDEQARSYDPKERGKTEAWVILAAEPGSVVYAGLNSGVTRPILAEAVRRGTVEECLHRVAVKVGDCIFIPAGTVHAIGEGVLLAEVQQSSDLTFRLFDWNRLGGDGQPRALHFEESLACIDFARGPVEPAQPVVSSDHAGQRVERLVDCPYFRINRQRLSQTADMPADDRCHVLMGLAGEVRLNCGDEHETLKAGGTVLIPASAFPISLDPLPAATFLDVTWD